MPTPPVFPSPDLVGRTTQDTYAWTERDVLLYALGVGAGQADAQRELQLTTENSDGPALRAVPTFGVLVTQDTIGLGTLEADQARVVHAEQALVLHRPLPTAGRARVTARVVAVLDKGSGALVRTEAVATDAATGAPLLTTRSAVFVRGAGGFASQEEGGAGGAPAPGPQPLPDRAADRTFTAEARADQALLYRLSGDRNPLHSDPAFAARAGFPRPILHGLATYGITARVLFAELCGSDPERFGAIEGRFTAPVLPGQRLTIEVWDGDGALRFRTRTAGGTVALDRGRLALRPA